MSEFDGKRRAADGADRLRDGAKGAADRASGKGANAGDRVTGETRTTQVNQSTEWDRVTRRYRRGLGGWWWLALLAVPALLAALSLGLNGSKDDVTATGTVNTPTASATTPANSATSSTTPASPTSTAAPAGNVNPFSVVKAGEQVTVTAVVPNADAKTQLLNAVKAQAGSATVIDKITVKNGAVAPVTAAVTSAVGAATKAGDYTVDYANNTVTLKGEVPAEADKTAAGEAAKASWPSATIDNQITVKGGAATGAAGCATLQKDIEAILAATKPTFANNGTQLTPAGTTVVQNVATKVKACPTAKLAVTGYTDTNGSDSINIPLSTNRAAAVKRVLVASGIPAANVTSAGKASADPIASNDTPEGMAKNRRVEIKVN